MKLKDLFRDIEFSTIVNFEKIKDIEVLDLAYNSKEAKEDCVFVALEGELADGHEYIDDAYENGSRIFIINRDIDLPSDGIKVLVKDTREVLSKISANFFNHPSKELKLIGITGTKGKTTTSNYIKAIFQHAGYNTGLIGTNGIFYNDLKEEAKNTTPESYEIQKTLRKMLDGGVEFVVMETSSGGLKMNRIDDVEFDLGVFTNISKDHIGPKEHPDFEDYLASKAKLFDLSKHGIINMDDKQARKILANLEISADTFSIIKESDFKAVDIELSKDIKSLGSRFKCKTSEGEEIYEIPAPGKFSIYNALGSIAVSKYFGIAYEDIKDALKDTSVSGRVEILPVVDYATVVLDFAHNAASLENIIQTLKEYEPRRLICLTGSVGDRSNLRRKEMGDIAARECDICILTSDNPDFEDPMKIIDEMAQSFRKSKCILIKEVDRKKAIEDAVAILEKNDILLLAGKGHETYNLVKGEKLYFSDKEIAIHAGEALLKLKGPSEK